MIKKFAKCFFLLLFALLAVCTAFAQAPIIKYATPQNYKLNAPIAPLKPVNSGGNVPTSEYGNVSTFAGSGQYSYTEGAANTASFKIPSDVVIDKNGNIYVADFPNQVIRKITPAGVVSTFAGNGSGGRDNGPGYQATFYAPTCMVMDAAGNIYVTDQYANEIRKITPSGDVSSLAGNGFIGKLNGNGAAASFSSPQGIAFGPDGALYVADLANHLIRRITLARDVSTFAGNGNTGSANGTGAQVSFGSPEAIAFDSKGNCYVGDAYSASIRKIALDGTVTTFAGTGNRGAIDGAGNIATFTDPHRLLFDANDNLFVADGNRIRLVTPAGVVSTIAGTDESGNVDGEGSAARLSGPGGMAISSKGILFFTEITGHLVKQMPLTGFFIDKPLPPGLVFDSATGTISGTPTALFATQTYTITARNKSGAGSTTVQIGVTDNALPPPVVAAPAISYVTPQIYPPGVLITPLKPINTGGAVPLGEYGTVTTFAGTGESGNTDGAADIATFQMPTHMAIDKDNNIFVTDQTSRVIRKITPQGVVSTFAGSGASGDADGNGRLASFQRPSGMAMDAAGNMYITDQDANLVRKVSPAADVSLLAGIGYAGNVNGHGAQARFNKPYSACIGPDGAVYVADYGNHQVRRVTVNGDVTTFSGNGGITPVNGSAAQASFGYPSGIAFDSYGNCYVGDLINFTIRKIATDGTVSTFAGNGRQVSVDGTRLAAGFTYPGNLLMDANDDLYVGDANMIRRITPQGVVTTVAGAVMGGNTDGVGTAASINGATSLAFDKNGAIFVSQFVNPKIRKITLTGFTIDRPLPPGLVFDETTGIISGTPAGPFPTTLYTITARNKGGMNTTKLQIGISSIPPPSAAPIIFYATPQIYTVNVPINTLKPSNTGGDVQPGGFSIDLPLPPGLTLDPNTGYISGTPTQIFPATIFTITATNAKGPSQATLNIKVGYPDLAIPAAPNITYNSPANKFILNTPINSLVLQNTGGEVKPGQSNGLLANYAGTGKAGRDDGQKDVATFDGPAHLLFNKAGELFFPEANNFDIRKISPAGITSTFALYVGINGFGVTGPRGFAMDSQGNLFAADATIIRKITPDGVVTVFAGSPVSGNADGNGKKASFDGIIALTIDKNDNIYVADQANTEIRKVTPNADVTTFAGRRRNGNIDGPGTVATFNSPSDITIDAAGNIYVADYLTVRKITLSGIVSTIAGNSTRTVVDGQGTAASFGNASGIAISPTGEIYIADTGNNVLNEGSDVLRVIDENNQVRTINIVGNTGNRTFLSRPVGAAFDKNGLLYISGNNNYIQTVSADRYIIDKPLPAGLIFDRQTGLISGTPTELSLITNYTITAYNTGGPSSETISIRVALTEVIEPSVITFPDFISKTTCDANFPTLAKSNDTSVPITYTSSNPAVAKVSETGEVQIIGEGTTTITASQTGSAFSLPATPVPHVLTISKPTAATKPSPAVDISIPLQTVQEGSTVTFTATTTGTVGNYRWLVNGQDAGATGTTFTTNTLADQDAVSCNFYFTDACIAPATSRTIKMNIVPIPVEITIPNTFTPNGDGINDTWQIPALAGCPTCTVSIFNRNGALIIRSTGYAKAWDGSYKGKPLPAGVYYYIIYKIGNHTKLAGSVTVLR